MTKLDTIARSLAALGHESRLAVFQLLVRAGDEGLLVGEIGAHLDIPLSTLSHHLRSLVDNGLVVQEKHGREIHNRVDYDAIEAVVAFLTAECCNGISIAYDS